MGANKFTHHVVQSMRDLYPEDYADTAWDNVGLLLGNQEEDTSTSRDHRVLLTNDLTPDVVDEAISEKVDVIVSYHPIIFRGLKSITLVDPQQESLIRLARNNIAVYSPHTALDAGSGGINDWLADAVIAARKSCAGFEQSRRLKVDIIKPVKAALPETSTGEPRDSTQLVGYGRTIRLGSPVPAPLLIKEFVRALGLPMSHVLVARPRLCGSAGDNGDDSDIDGVAVCAGSGFDLLRDAKDVQMLITGEVSHHDALYATTRGIWVVCLLHSNSERRFLEERLQKQLAARITSTASYAGTKVLVSKQDRDPFQIWDVNHPPERDLVPEDSS